MKHLNFLSNLLSLSLGSQSSEVGFDCRLTVGSPSFDCRSAMLKLVSVLVLILTVGSGNVWGADLDISLNFNQSSGNLFSLSTSSANDASDTISKTYGGYTYRLKAPNSCYYYSGNVSGTKYNSLLMGKSGACIIFPAISGKKLTKVTIGISIGSSTATVAICEGRGTTVTTGGTGDNSWAKGETHSWTLTNTTANKEYNARVTSNHNIQITTIALEYTNVASCTDYATVEAGSNSSVTKNSARVTCSSGISSLGSAGCSISSYGFVLGTSSNPTTSNTTYEVGTSYTSTGVSFYKDITGLSAGTTYYVRPYATNGNGTAYGTQTTFTTLFEASITLNKNTSDAGSTAGSAKAVENATSLSSITAPTRTGYNLEGYYTTAECATKIATSAGAFQPSITVSSNTWTNGSNQWKRNASETFYAKWTAKTTTVSFNQTSGTGGQTGTLTATYGSAMPSAPVTCPTRTGYDFGGYYDGSGGTGTQYYTSTGASARTWNKEDATYTLHAKWTIKNYTITWKVNGETWSDKGGSTNANYNTAWSSLTLPTAPDPENDGCGQKFVGWTTTENYSNATTAPTDLLNADNKSGKTAVLITDNVVFHAVFADYDE